MKYLGAVKELSIATGIYKIFRTINDNFIDRSRGDRREARIRFYRDLVSPGDLCFDIGSNIGDISAVLLSLGARVVAVDPQPAAIREFSARFGKRDDLTLVEAGLDKATGSATLFLHEEIGTTSMLEDWPAGRKLGSITVPVVTLESLIAQHGVPAYCKIDVEGFELRVLQGLSRRIDLLSLEYHFDPEGIESINACLEYLQSLGTLTLNVLREEDGGFCSADWMTVPEFRDFVVSEVARKQTVAYGDVFIRMAAPN